MVASSFHSAVRKHQFYTHLTRMYFMKAWQLAAIDWNLMKTFHSDRHSRAVMGPGFPLWLAMSPLLNLTKNWLYKTCALAILAKSIKIDFSW